MINSLHRLPALYRRLIILMTVLPVMQIIFTGCRSNHSTPTDRAESATGMSTQQRLVSVIDNSDLWQQLQYPVKISMTSPARFSLSGRLYMVRDKMIYLSMRVLGLEVASACITGDSIKILDRVHNKYLAEAVSDLTDDISLTVGNVQSALLGFPFIIGNEHLDPKALKHADIVDTADGWRLLPRGHVYGADYMFDFDDATNDLTRLSVIKGARSATADYSGDMTTAVGRIASKIEVNASIGSKPLQLTISSTLKSLKTTVNDNIGDISTRGYERINMSDLLKLFK